MLADVLGTDLRPRQAHTSQIAVSVPRACWLVVRGRIATVIPSPLIVLTLRLRREQTILHEQGQMIGTTRSPRSLAKAGWVWSIRRATCVSTGSSASRFFAAGLLKKALRSGQLYARINSTVTPPIESVPMYPYRPEPFLPTSPQAPDCTTP
jgi:hypothetical protein